MREEGGEIWLGRRTEYVGRHAHFSSTLLRAQHAVHPKGAPIDDAMQQTGSAQQASFKPSANMFGLFCFTSMAFCAAPRPPLALISLGGSFGQRKQKTMACA